MIRFALFLGLVSSMSPIVLGDDPAATDPVVVLERMNAQLLEQTKKLDACMEACDVIVRQVQSGLPIQVGKESQRYRKVRFPFLMPATGTQLETLKFNALPTCPDELKVFHFQVDELPKVIRQNC